MSATWLRDWCIFYKAKTVFADVSNRNKLHHATCDINIRADFVLILGLILVHLVQIRAANFVLFCFFKNLAPPVTRYHAQLSSGTISEKN